MSNNQAANKRLARNSLLMSLRMVVILCISLYTTRAILEVLGIESYGVYNVVSGFVMMFTFLNTSMASASQRFYNSELAKNGLIGASIVFRASLRIHIWLGVIIAVIVELVGSWYIYYRLVLPDYQLYAAIFIFNFSIGELFLNIVGTPFSAAVMAHERMDFLAGIEILRVTLKLGAVFILYLVMDNRLIWYGALNLIITTLIIGSYIFFCINKFVEIKKKVTIPNTLYKEMLSFSSWGLLGSMAYSLRDQGVNLVLNYFFGPLINAARGVSNQVNGALQGFVANLVTPARPQIIKSYSVGDYDRSWKLMFTISKMTCLFFYAMSLPILLQVNYILHLWLGSEIPQYTSIFVILLLITNIFGTYVSPLSIIIQATGKIKLYQLSSGISNLLTVPLAYIFLTWIQTPILAYISLFVTMVTNTLCGLISAHKEAGLKYREFLSHILLPCILVMICSLPLSIWPTYLHFSDWLKLLLTICASFISVISFSYKIALNKEEKKFAKAMINKILSRYGQ